MNNINRDLVADLRVLLGSSSHKRNGTPGSVTHAVELFGSPNTECFLNVHHTSNTSKTRTNVRQMQTSRIPVGRPAIRPELLLLLLINFCFLIMYFGRDSFPKNTRDLIKTHFENIPWTRFASKRNITSDMRSATYYTRMIHVVYSHERACHRVFRRISVWVHCSTGSLPYALGVLFVCSNTNASGVLFDSGKYLNYLITISTCNCYY